MRSMTYIGAALFAACLAGAASAQPVTIRDGWVAPGNWGSIWLQKKDLAKHFGQSYVMEPVHYVGTPPMITALATNEVEVTNLAYSTLGIAIGNAGLDDLRIISDEFQDGVEGYYSQGFILLKVR
jgi:sulfonate transport system substrate-binding protein